MTNQYQRRPTLGANTINFISANDIYFESLKQDVREEAMAQENILPLPGMFFLYGRMSINQEIWTRCAALMRLLKDNEMTDASKEMELMYLMRELGRYLAYRSVHTPPADMYLHDPEQDMKKLDTFTSLPAVTISPSTNEVQPTGGTQPIPDQPTEGSTALSEFADEVIQHNLNALEELAGKGNSSSKKKTADLRKGSS
jgi:hypothetical protein